MLISIPPTLQLRGHSATLAQSSAVGTRRKLSMLARAPIPELAFELAQMVERDQEIRRRIFEGRQRPSSDELDELASVDETHTARLAEIIDEYGWPGRSLVGVRGAHDAWLLAQHGDPVFQERALVLLTAAVDADEADAKDLAYLVD